MKQSAQLLCIALVCGLVACAHSPQKPINAATNGVNSQSDNKAIKALQKSRYQQAVSRAADKPANKANNLLSKQQDSSFNRPLSRFNVAANDVSAKEFFVSLVTGSDVNIIVHPDVNGNISINLKQVTLEEALSAVRDAYNYDFVRHSYGYQIVPKKIQSKVFPLNYLNVNRIGKSSTSVSSGQITSNNSSDGSSSSSTDSVNGSDSSSGNQAVKSTQIQTESRSNFWSKLESMVRSLVGSGDGRQVIVDAHSGIVVVKAFPSELREVEDFLKKAQLSLQRQVVIEAKVIEVSLGDGYQAGIQWDTFGLGYGGELTNTSKETVGALAAKPINELIDNSIEGIFTLGLNFNDFTGVINLLESQGDVQVLSSPRIATVNNQKAVIKVGTDEFFVTEISNSTTSTSTSTVASPEVTLTPFFSGIALDVTPHIGEDSDVILHVHPTVTEVTERIKNIGVGDNNLVLPLAYSSIRETDSIIRAADGQIVIIGGLMQTKAEKKQAGVPLLSRIPGVGKLFMQERDVNKKSELVILLKPKVVNLQQWQEDYDLLLQRFPDLIR